MIPSSLQSLLKDQSGENQKWLTDIKTSDEFQFSKAITALQNWKDLIISKSDLERMLNMKYEEFRDSTDTDISRVRHTLFTLVAYCDTKANNKRLLNEYPDKRTIAARASIYQNVWVKQLLLLKYGSPASNKKTQNMIAYLESPSDNWPIIAENHRQQILLWLTGKQYNRATFNQDMEEALGKYWNGKNPDNKTTYFTRCIYYLDNEWKNPTPDRTSYSEIKGDIQPTPADPYMEKLVRLLEKNRNLILTGAPGTGKTYLAAQIAKAMNAQYERVQFHPSYDYTDFVEGLRPEKNEGKEIGFKLMPGSFKLFCQKALDSLDNNPEESPKYLFHIDEINRGEISKIFGELFFSIEPSYRGEKGKVKTQYHNLITDGDIFEDGFFVPENVYIIGTMNDIDRGVEAMDFAIRRRFAWIEVKASDRLQMLDSMTESGVSQSVIDEAKLRMTSLNNAISEVESLGDAYHVGGAYFLNLTNYIDDPDPFGKLWEYHLRGLLYEYLRGSEAWKETLNKFKDEYDHPKADHTDH